MVNLNTVDDVKKTIDTQQKAIADQLGKLDKLDSAVIELRQKYDDAVKRADALEAAAHGRKRWGREGPRPISDVLMESQVFGKAATMGRGERFEVPVATKDILGLGVQLPDVVPIAGGPSYLYEVASLIPTIETRSGAVSFLRETSFTDNTNVVLEGQLKPKSDKTFEKVTLPIEVIAHYFKVSKQSYEDTAGLAAEIESNLLDGLAKKVEQQLLKGTGTTPQLVGLYTVATAATALTGTPTIIDTLIAATTQLAVAGYRATGIVLSPQDAGSMALLKDSTGRYLLGGLPPLPRTVVSPLLAAGEWLVGDFSRARIIMRQEATVEVGIVDDDFIRNQLTVLGEVRLALAVYQLGAFLKNPAPAGFAAEAETPRKQK